MLIAAVFATAGLTAAPAIFNKAVDVDGMRCATMVKPMVATPERPFCCESCHHPFLLTNDVETLSVVTTASVENVAFTYKELTESQVGSGSRDLSLLSSSDTKIIELSDVMSAEFTATAPCGYCVSLDECKGNVELWHHKCHKSV